MSAPSLVKGWCPTALRPMPTGDGLLVRIRLGCGRLSLDRARAIADCAARFGNGAIEISARANLQLRGISESGLPDLQMRLDELGLLDPREAMQGLPNIVASPISDIDPTAVIDVAPIVARLEHSLPPCGGGLGRGVALSHPTGAKSVLPTGHRDPPPRPSPTGGEGEEGARSGLLPPKFSFLVDGGGVLALGDVEADVRFEAFHGGEDTYCAVTLAGARDVAAQCRPDGVPEAAAALARAFLREASHRGVRRMRDLVAQCGAAAVFAAADLALSAPSPLRRKASQRDFLGVHVFGASTCIGAAPSLGRLTADDLRTLAQEAARCSAVDIRVTPWRALIVTGLDQARADDLAAALAQRGFILDPADPRLAIVACAGAPGCANAARAVQADALDLTPLIGVADGIVLHVSGCEKGCAHAKPAPLTLIARASGYDLVVNGKASDKPAREMISAGTIASVLAREYGALLR
jgi:precorrin-3B synthase